MLQVNDLRVSYSGIEVVHGVSLNVAAGECVALIGANGAGNPRPSRRSAGSFRLRAERSV